MAFIGWNPMIRTRIICIFAVRNIEIPYTHEKIDPTSSCRTFHHTDPCIAPTAADCICGAKRKRKVPEHPDAERTFER